MRVPPALAITPETSVPVLLAAAASSLMAVKLMLPVLSRTGASLTALTVSEMVAVLESAKPSLILKVKLSSPL